MNLFDIADKVIVEAYPGKPKWWGATRIPNYGILRCAIVSALMKVVRPGEDCPCCDGTKMDKNIFGLANNKPCTVCKGTGKRGDSIF